MGVFVSVISKIKNTGTGNEKGNSLFPYQRNLSEIYKKVRENLDIQETGAIAKPFLENEPKIERKQMVKMEQIKENSKESVKDKLPLQVNEQGDISTNQQFEKMNLIDAIIWSEIIGEPRSKKPYFPKKLG